MKSDAEIMPGTDADSLSHKGADARPWSCSAWNACGGQATGVGPHGDCASILARAACD